MSLVFRALMIVVSIKYVVFVMRADNNGEGGILSLLALTEPHLHSARRHALKLFALIPAHRVVLLGSRLQI